MIRMLRKVKRISTTASARSFGEYVAVVARALKIKRALRELDHSTPQSSCNFHEYVQVETSGVAGVIDKIVEKVRGTAVKSARRQLAEPATNPGSALACGCEGLQAILRLAENFAQRLVDL
jgi:hypothetical protein